MNNLKKTKNDNQLGRASAFISEGSLSVEAAFAAPFFLLAMLCILYLFEIMCMETTLRTAFYSAARQVAKEAYVSTAFPGVRLEHYITENLKESEWNCKGIDCSGSYCQGDSTIMDLSMEYQIELPVLMFDIPLMVRKEEVRVKGWTGYEGDGFYSGSEDIVYITDTGIVYHSTPRCNYLDLSIQRVSLEEAKERYVICSLCKEERGATNYVYVTTYGTAYHISLNCSSLKRSIYAVKESETHGKGGCSKCVR